AGHQGGEGEVVDEGLLAVADERLDGADLAGALLDGLEVLLVAEVDGEGDDVVAALLLEPADRDGRIEPAGVGEDDLLGHGVSSVVCVGLRFTVRHGIAAGKLNRVERMTMDGGRWMMEGLATRIGRFD